MEINASQVSFIRRLSSFNFYRFLRRGTVLLCIVVVITVIFSKRTLVSRRIPRLMQSHFPERQEHNATDFTANGGLNTRTKQPFIKTKTDSVYLFSAIIAILETNQQIKQNLAKGNSQVSTTAIVTGWEPKRRSSSDFKCCFILKNGSFSSVLSGSKSSFYIGMAKLQAKQFKCPINLDVHVISLITILYDKNATCPMEHNYYIRPSIMKRKSCLQNSESRTIGACVKLTYGSLDPQRLIEWFETHKLLGVDKVIAYTYQLNSKAAKVLKFYEKNGMADTYGFDIPQKDIIKRNVGDKNTQCWNDEQVVLFDCQERLRNYDYVAIVDTDEFLLPSTKHFNNAWKNFFKKKFDKENIGAMYFNVRIHAYTWGPSNKSHPLHIGQYSNCTLPMYDRPKTVYMPSRIRQGSVTTHRVGTLKGYKNYIVEANKAVIHHYRLCRNEWLKSKTNDVPMKHRHLFYMTNTTKCADFRRSYSADIAQLAETITDEVLRIKEEIQL